MYVLRNLTEKLGNSPSFFERDESCSSISPFPCRNARGEREQENEESSGGNHWPLRICLEMGAYFMDFIASHSQDIIPASRFYPKIGVMIHHCLKWSNNYVQVKIKSTKTAPSRVVKKDSELISKYMKAGRALHHTAAPR